MEKVFARVRFSSPLSVAEARTSQSPFPLYAMSNKKTHKMKHPLNYSLEDFEKLLKQKLKITYKNYKKEEEEIEGFLIYVHPTNMGDIKPHSITLDLGREERIINIFDITKIS